MKKTLMTLVMGMSLGLTAACGTVGSEADEFHADGSESTPEGGFSEEFHSSLTEDDYVGYSDSYYTYYEVNVLEGRTLSILLTSEDFDTYMALYYDDAFIAANDDMTSDDTNSYFSIEAPYSGTYLLLVSSYNGTELGNYDLYMLAE